MTHPPEQGQTLDASPYDLPLDLDHMPADYAEAVEMLRRAKRRLKAIDEAVVPEMPPEVAEMRSYTYRQAESVIAYIDALKLHTQKSADAARVAREELADMTADRDFYMDARCKYYDEAQQERNRANAAESRLREVEARTKERCAEAAEALIGTPTGADTGLLNEFYRGCKAAANVIREMDNKTLVQACRAEDRDMVATPAGAELIARAVDALRALPSSTDTEEK